MSRRHRNQYHGQGQPTVINNNIVNNGRKTNHLLHLILTLITGGLWAIVWVILIIVRS